MRPTIIYEFRTILLNGQNPDNPDPLGDRVKQSISTSQSMRGFCSFYFAKIINWMIIDVIALSINAFNIQKIRRAD